MRDRELKKQLNSAISIAKKIINIDDESKLSETIDEYGSSVTLKPKKAEYTKRHGRLVHIIKVPHNLSINKKIKRDADGIIIKAVDANYLVEKLTQSALFQKCDSTSKIKYKSCPRRHADYLLSRGEWRLPILKGVINTPIISLDGTIFNITGYNQETGLIFNYNESDFDQIPENLSIDAARAAMKIIEDVVIEFPFATDTVDKSVALACILTAIIRPAIKTAPIFL